MQFWYWCVKHRFFFHNYLYLGSLLQSIKAGRGFVYRQIFVDSWWDREYILVAFKIGLLIFLVSGKDCWDLALAARYVSIFFLSYWSFPLAAPKPSLMAVSWARIQIQTPVYLHEEETTVLKLLTYKDLLKKIRNSSYLFYYFLGLNERSQAQKKSSSLPEKLHLLKIRNFLIFLLMIVWASSIMIDWPSWVRIQILVRMRIQHLKCNGSRVLMTNLKNTAEIIFISFFCDQKLQFTYP